MSLECVYSSRSVLFLVACGESDAVFCCCAGGRDVIFHGRQQVPHGVPRGQTISGSQSNAEGTGSTTGTHKHALQTQMISLISGPDA